MAQIRHFWLTILVGTVFAASTIGCQRPKDPGRFDPDLAKPFLGGAESKDPSALSEERQREMDEADGVPLPEKLRCAQDICGAPDGVMTPSDLVSQRLPDLPEASALIEGRLRDRLDKLFEISIRYQRKRLALIDRVLPSLSAEKVRPQETALINMMWALRHLGKAAAAIRGHAGSYSFDETRLKAALSDLSAPDLENAKAFLLHFMNSDVVQELEILGSTPFDDYLRLRRPGQDLARAKREFALEHLKYLRDLQNALGGGDFLRTPRALKALADGGDLTEQEQVSMHRVLAYKYYHRVVIEERELFLRRPLDVAELRAEWEKKKIGQTLRDALEEPSRLERLRAEALAQCRSDFSAILRATPTADEVARALRMANEAKAAAKRLVALLAPDDRTRAEAGRRIEALGFNAPLNRDQVLKALAEVHEVSMDEAREGVEKIGELSDGFALILVAQLLGDEKVQADERLRAFCGYFRPGSLSDSIMTSLGKINLSWATVKFPEYGLGILGHEIGHLVSSAWLSSSSSAYMSVFSCLSDRHRKNGLSYANEDFADLFGARLVREMKDKYRGRNFACALMGEDNRRYGIYRGLTLRWPESHVDPHAPDLFRLIQIENAASEKIPASCQALVGRHAPEMQKACSAF